MKIYREIYKNASMGAQSIEDVMKYVDCEKLRETLTPQKEGLYEFIANAKKELSKADLEEVNSYKLQKTMVKASVNMNAMFNRDTSHIAAMLIDGYNTGIVSVQKCINECENDGVTVPELAREMMKTYDKNIKTLRTFL